MKTLFISYKSSDNSFGNCTISLNDDESIETIEDIRHIQKQIEINNNLQKVIIDNMIMLPIK